MFVGGVHAADWPWWRGPDHDDHTTETSGYEQGAWPLRAPVWQAEVGVGDDSVVVAAGRLYTVGWREGTPPQDAVTCLDATTGQQLWTQQYPAAAYGRRHHGDENWFKGPLATPTFDAPTRLLYTLGADGALNCWDTAQSGQRVWGLNLYDSYTILPRADEGHGQRDYGYITAPLISGDWLLVQAGSSEGTLFAFDKHTGRRLWASQHKAPPGHCGGMTPAVIDGVPCVIMVTLEQVVVVRLDEGHPGETLLTYPWRTEYGSNITTPVVAGDCLILTSAHNIGRTECLKMSLTGLTKLWQTRLYSKVCVPVVLGSHLYFAWNRLHCLDLATGQEVWSGGQFGDDVSLVATADERLIVFGEMKLGLVDSAAQSPGAYHELAMTAPLDTGLGWPHVVVSNGRLFAKSAAGQIWCYSLTGPTSVAAGQSAAPQAH